MVVIKPPTSQGKGAEQKRGNFLLILSLCVLYRFTRGYILYTVLFILSLFISYILLLFYCWFYCVYCMYF